MTSILKFILPIIFLFIYSCKKDKTPPPFFEVTPQPVVEIADGLIEISGMIYQNDTTIIAHNDGGHGPSIYDISLEEKKINRQVKISNTENIDWEDITQDQQYIYISEAGNNRGQRMDLKILKILKSDFQSKDSVNAEFINFHYPDQTDFSASDNHNFDCEAIISFGDQLFLFSKNRKDAKTKLYTLPKSSGDHAAILKKEFDVEGLITGASINDQKNVIALLGYHYNSGNFTPFVLLLYEFEGANIFDGKNTRLKFTIGGQMESICFGENNNLYFAPESESGGEVQSVYHLDVTSFLN